MGWSGNTIRYRSATWSMGYGVVIQLWESKPDGEIHADGLITGLLKRDIFTENWKPMFVLPSNSGWWFQPLWKIWKSIGMIIPNIWGNSKNGNQTTNQNWLRFPVSIVPSSNSVMDWWPCPTGFLLSNSERAAPRVNDTSTSKTVAGSEKPWHIGWGYLRITITFLEWKKNTWNDHKEPCYWTYINLVGGLNPSEKY